MIRGRPRTRRVFLGSTSSVPARAEGAQRRRHRPAGQVRWAQRVCRSVGSACRSATHGFRSSGCAQAEVAGRPPRSNSDGPHHGRHPLCCQTCGAHAVAQPILELWGRRRQNGASAGNPAPRASAPAQGSRGEQLPNLDVDLDTARTLDIGSHAVLEAGTLQDSTSLLGPVPALRGGSRILDGRGH